MSDEHFDRLISESAARLAKYGRIRRKQALQKKLRRKAADAPETAALEWALRTFAGPMRAVRA